MSNKNTKAERRWGSLRVSNRIWAALATIGLHVLALGCGGDPKIERCDPGTENCPCLAGDVQCRGGGNLVCVADVCRKQSCTPGSRDCACFPNLTCNKNADGTWLVCDQGVCGEASCRQGDAGCGCYPNGTCNNGLSCSDESGSLRCLGVNCTPGTLGCTCASGGTCSATDAGAALACVKNTCAATNCTPGALNCSCKQDRSCDAGLACDPSGVCKSSQCPAGTANCPCLSDHSCSTSNLTCSTANVCVSKTCTQGEEGCACKPDLTCVGNAANGKALVCLQGVCAASSCNPGDHACPCTTAGSCSKPTDSCSGGQCVTSSCPEGALGCACLSGQICGKTSAGAALACVAGICTDCQNQNCVTTGLLAPQNPPCFSPCRKGLKMDAGYLECPADGLMRHAAGGPCLDNRTCSQGSCIEPGTSVPTCQGDIECPDFQNCVEGKCYSVCENTSECPQGLACYRHACRKACASNSQSCTGHTACLITDGSTGYCMPVGAPPSAPAEGEVLGTFQLSNESIEFNAAHVNDSFTITNSGPIAAKFKITKLEHSESEGTNRVTVNPMPWLKMGEPGSEALRNEFSVIVDPNSPLTISLKDAATSNITRWQGAIEVRSEDARLGARKVQLSYAGSVDGRWTGTIYYFANFGTQNLNTWLAERSNVTKLQVVGNALVQRWGDFRLGSITYANFQAAFQSAVTESWRWPTVQAGCPAAACYPYVDASSSAVSSGLQQFSRGLTDFPIPTGITQLPIALDLQADSLQPEQMSGLIPTSEALHYPGNPAITSLVFESIPNAASCPSTNNGQCVVFASSLSATINIGGRYLLPGVSPTDTCPSGWQAQDTPWLVPGFVSWTGTSEKDGLLYRRECRDQTQPWGASAASIPLNVALAAGNPIADGKTRSRRLELLDGALINQDSMFLLVRESFESFLGATDQSQFAVHAAIMLQRAPGQISTYVGSTPPATQDPPAAAARGLSCPTNVLTRLGYPGGVTSSNVASVVGSLLDGLPVSVPAPLETSQVHYICQKTGKIDGGNTIVNGASFECPADSNVSYFYFADQTTMPTAGQIAALPCQNTGTCQETLDTWRSNKTGAIASEPPAYRCLPDSSTGAERVFCDTNLTDRRSDKVFYPVETSARVFSPLRTAINDAFRYKTQFRTRTGGKIGFAPEPCVPNSDAVPYCYDAAQIEEARGRVDCALSLYASYPEIRSVLNPYLTVNFAYDQTIAPPVYTYDGFEMLYSELLVMLGDDAYTNSFSARFDLAGTNKLSFQGSLFEPNGINLSGAAGYEMYELYQATQYYSLVLDRFYDLIPYMTTPTGEFWDFITQDKVANQPSPTFTSYFPKLVRASAQKTRAWSEVAKRYQNFNRPDLARRVIERAYTSAYTELSLIRNLMTRYLKGAKPENQPDAIEALRKSALTYGAALFDMRDVYQKITDDVVYFGFAPDYMPFPALDPSDSNAFSKLLGLANQRLTAAAAKEQLALTSDNSYNTSSASFQSELVKLRINYDNQLADICGTFTGDDGVVYPAIPAYAYKSAKVAPLGDPCGFTGTGKLHAAMGQLEALQLDVKGVIQKYDTLFEETAIERRRVTEQCGISNAIAEAKYKLADEVRLLQDDINAAELNKTKLGHAAHALDVVRETAGCIIGTASDCGSKLASATIYFMGILPIRGMEIDEQREIDALKADIGRLQAAEAFWEGLQQCKTAQVESNAKIATQLLGLKAIDLEALKTGYSLKLAVSQIQQYRDQAKRLSNEMQEMEEQAINIEAARNDPNVRIYKNDAIINADRTFESALAAAYQATKVYEYYTSQSYGRFDQLFLVRMIGSGDYNLENYMTELQDAYFSFQQQFGNPDERVDILSLRDDVFDIPRLDNQGAAVSQSDRIASFRAKLTDVALLDESGYLTVPFATSLARLSPLTRDHKIKRIEVEIIGSDVGDSVGRVYLRQAGTGSVRSVSGDSIYYRFPELTAVLDPFFNGVRALGAEIYASDRLRDRPYVNSRWDLVINQKDELVNKDIDLNSITDIRIYFYYTDFTAQ